MNRRNHISTARRLAGDLRAAHSKFALEELHSLASWAFWDALQPEPALVQRFREFLDTLYFDGIRSRFFGEFDPSKLILPIADDIASRLDTLADDLETQCAAEAVSQFKRGHDEPRELGLAIRLE